MDQGGLKRSGNRDDSLTFGETGVRVGRDTGDTASSLLPSPMHLPCPGSLPQPTASNNGQGGTKDHREFGGLFETPQNLALPDMKEGKMIRGQKQQHQDIDLFSMEDNLLKQSISDLNQTSTSVINTSESSVLGNFPLPDLFPQHIKQEVNFSLDKELETYSGHAGAGLGDLDGNSSHLMEGTEIWQALDLPGSLSETNSFELISEVAHLEHNILLESRSGIGGADGGVGGGVGPVGSLLKETKSLVGNGINCTNVNGANYPIQQHPHQQQQQHHLLQHQQHQLHHHQQPGSLLSTIMVKEKDSDNTFSHIRTSAEVKQEKKDGDAFGQVPCLHNSMSSPYDGGAISLPMGVSAGPPYHYSANPSAAAALQDQKPFAMYSNMPVVGENWATGKRYGESSGTQRGDNGIPSSTALGNFSLSFSR